MPEEKILPLHMTPSGIKHSGPHGTTGSDVPPVPPPVLLATVLVDSVIGIVVSKIYIKYRMYEFLKFVC